ncbi:MAG: hypothetical protein KAS32_16985 [Candidatus Peribacteraceae bacterium]|nr:hypothetical protein [Candidatus Peribacteraceae bacterium]
MLESSIEKLNNTLTSLAAEVANCTTAIANFSSAAAPLEEKDDKPAATTKKKAPAKKAEKPAATTKKKAPAKKAEPEDDAAAEVRAVLKEVVSQFDRKEAMKILQDYGAVEKLSDLAPDDYANVVLAAKEKLAEEGESEEEDL